MPELMIFQKGGLIMYGLAALSVYAVAVVIFKILQFRKANVFDRSFIEPALRDIKQGDRQRASTTLAGIRGPVARIMRVTFECVANREMSQKSKEAEILRVGSGDIRYLESHLRGLEMTASVAPLMGLLGTVIGMIGSFSRLSMSGSHVDPTVLAGGIWEALLCTAGGLAVAIPAMAAHYMLDGVIEKVRATMKDVSVQILALEDEFRRNERAHAIEEARRAEETRRMQEEQRRQQEEAIRRQREEEDRQRRDAETRLAIETRLAAEAKLAAEARQAAAAKPVEAAKPAEDAPNTAAEAPKPKAKKAAAAPATATMHMLNPKINA